MGLPPPLSILQQVQDERIYGFPLTREGRCGMWELSLPGHTPGQQFRLVQHFGQDRELMAGQFLVEDLLAGLRIVGPGDVEVRILMPVVVFQRQVPAGDPSHIVVADAPDLPKVAPIAKSQFLPDRQAYLAPAQALPPHGDPRNAALGNFLKAQNAGLFQGRMLVQVLVVPDQVVLEGVPAVGIAASRVASTR